MGLVAHCALAGHDDDLVEEAARPGVQERTVFANFNVHQNIDQWLYGSQRGQGRPGGKGSLYWNLERRVAEISRTAGLSEDQKHKLLLAGEGDIRRFEDRVEEIKSKFSADGVSRDEINRVFQEIRPLQIELNRGLFERDSLYAKTLEVTLTADQVRRSREEQRDRDTFQYRAAVEMAVLQLAESVGLTERQQELLIELILERAPLPRYRGRQQHYAIYMVLKPLLDGHLKPQFQEWQWRRLLAAIEQSQITVDNMVRDGTLVEQEEEFLDPSNAGSTRPASRRRPDLRDRNPLLRRSR